MVAAGYPHQNGRHIEVIDLIDPDKKCEFVEERAERDRVIGGLLQNTVG